MLSAEKAILAKSPPPSSAGRGGYGVSSLVPLAEDEGALQGALKKFFDKVGTSKGRDVFFDLMPLLYSNIKPLGQGETGAEIASLLFMGFDGNYTVPADERTFIESNGGNIGRYFQRFSTPITLVSLGCGPFAPVTSKDVPLIRAVGAKRYVAVDMNGDFARNAATVVRESEAGLQSTRAVYGDITKPFELEPSEKKTLVVFSLLGDTIGQYPVKKAQNSHFTNGVCLQGFLKNLKNVAGENACFLASLDVETRPDALVAKYHGPVMNKLMRTLWFTIGAVVGDKKFCPSAFNYHAEYDPENSAAQFVHTSSKRMQFSFMGEQYVIPKNQRIIIGCSQKRDVSEILPDCQKAGWQEIPEIPTFTYVNTVRMLALKKPWGPQAA